jgi:hypothetical protein
MAKPANDGLRVVIFQEGDAWIAQGLEHDICAQGSDLSVLRERFVATLEAELDHAREQGKQTLEHIGPAPDHFFQMWKERSSFSEKLGGNDDGQVELALCA